MAPRPMRVAVAGAGIIARVHLANLATLEGVEVTGVADLDEARAREAAPVGARVLADAEALLDDAPDALVVCLPPAMRGDLVERAASRDVHVYVEKPAALTLDEARRTLRAVEDAGVVAAVGHMWRSTAAARAMRTALDGAPHALMGRLLNGPPGPAWSFDAALSGGLLVEFGSHLLDAMRAVGGEVARVSGVGASVTPDPGARGPDTALLTLWFASGAVGTAQVSWAHHGAAWDVLALTGAGPLLWQLGPERLEGHAAAEPQPPPGPWHGFGGPSWHAALSGFIAAARAGRPGAVGCTYRDAAGTLALALAAREAVRTGGIIDVEAL